MADVSNISHGPPASETHCGINRSLSPAVSSSGDHKQLFSVAVALMNGFGLDEDTAPSWPKVYNVCCVPVVRS
jgi:hypothetical protein